ncbi:dTDP-4-dehydrorhamnose reductase [Mucilaginibacter mali]|uniref:dTDP-4-dehydrorhamnose reductase n=1 Tax=Mucilaginibacter mali TaxID=2740462 RepID=A0A7D4QD90_9SPHI|nr:dTDP-4-dehydrorhamnose reductase [Mucilaginibacter mali]QKJ31464.1 dTDP-4-dehydrorhamnose reductase [Mucilaginibacter mali]
MSKTLVFGASGQLGQCLKLVVSNNQVANVYFPDETVANILDTNSLKKLFDEYQPDFCINCAAYTAVDKAETDIDIARKVNKDGAANLAVLCQTYNATLIHVSTDFVFDGKVPHLLSETDEAKPISIYGLTKLEGEQDIADTISKYYILRTSWLYSEYGNNFVKTMLKLGAERDQLKVIADQIGTPTYAVDLAETIMHIIQSGKQEYGIYHYSNEGVTSWYDFAKAIFDLSDTSVNLYPITTAEYPTAATRPAFSVMNKAKIKNTFGITIPYWRDSLAKCINILKP